jgi:hypothetical protein
MMRVAFASLLTTVALLAGAGAALADGVTINVTAANGQSDPAAYLPRVLTVSGTATGSKYLYVKHRATGGGACAPSAFTDSGTWVDPTFYSVPVNGSFSVQRILTWRSPGTWMFCFWLASAETTVTTPITQALTFRPAAGAIGATVSPAVPRPDQRALITIAGTSEAPRRVYAKVRAADGGGCASTYDADPGEGMTDGWSVDGAFSIKAYTTRSTPGAYLICTWLAGSSDDPLPVAGPQAQTFNVVSGPPVVSSVSTLNCKTRRAIARVRAIARFRASKIKSVCMRYRFSRAPWGGAPISVSYVTPKRRTYKTVRSTWSSPQSQTLTTASLPGRAYKHRRGTWRVILHIGSQRIKTTSFRVT